jgi:multiple sugar transport system ATP-binding protein
MTLGDRVVVMKDGVVQQVGEPLELYGRPANRFVASFIGSPAMNFADVTINSAGGGLWAEAPGLRIAVPGHKREALRGLAGQRVTLGVRPEALRPANGADPSDYAFDSTVEVVEQLGNEILLDVRAGNHLMVARVDPGVRVKVRDAVRLSVDPDRLHFFDAKTEDAI